MTNNDIKAALSSTRNSGVRSLVSVNPPQARNVRTGETGLLTLVQPLNSTDEEPESQAVATAWGTTPRLVNLLPARI